MGGVTNPIQTVADPSDASSNSIDEDVHPIRGVVDSIDEDIDASQKVGDACQRVYCLKPFIHLTF